MLNTLDKYYSSISNNSTINRIVKYVIRVSANIYARNFMRCNSKKEDINANTVIVSLTSFPARIKNLHITIKSLMNQDYENMRIFLWLSKDQFSSINDLPKDLLSLQANGLSICLVDDDLRPHKKYHYAMQMYPNHNIITVDDDILYHSHLVSALMDSHSKHPNCVICNRGITIGTGSYTSWTPAEMVDRETYSIMPTGIGGVLYPVDSYDRNNIFDIQAIKRTCINGDDLWLNYMTRSKGTKVVLTGFKTGLITQLSSQSSALCNENVLGNRNDIQISALEKWLLENNLDDFHINCK